MSGSTYRPDLDGRWDEALASGEHAFSAPPPDRPKWLRFGCRRNPTEACQIALRPQRNGVGASWEWDGNREAPTISPSVNCEKVCGWHGWIRSGQWTP